MPIDRDEQRKRIAEKTKRWQELIDKGKKREHNPSKEGLLDAAEKLKAKREERLPSAKKGTETQSSIGGC